MGPSIAIPAHLAVHVVGVAVCLGLILDSVRQRERGTWWIWMAMGASLLGMSHVLVGGLLVDHLGWPMALRAAGYVGLAIGAAGGLGRMASGAPVLVLPALVPVAPRGSHVVAALAGTAAAFAWLRGTVASGALLATGLGLWAASDLAVSFAEIPAAVLSVAGSVVVAAWLLRRAQASLLAKVAVSFVAILVLVVIGLAALGGALLGADLERDALDRLRDAADARAEEVTVEWPEQMLTVSRMFGQEAVAAALEDGDPGRLERLTRGIAELPDVDVVVLLDGDGTVAASYEWTIQPAGALPGSDELGIAGDDVVAAALEGASSSGVVPLGSRGAVAIGATPIHVVEEDGPRRDQLAGVLIAGRRLADPIYLQRVASGANAEATAVVGGDVAGSTLAQDQAAVVAAAVVAGESDGTTEIDGQPVFVVASPLTRVDATWIVLTREAGAVAGAEERFTRALFLLVLAGLAIALPVGGWAARRTTRPILMLTEAAERVARGDLEVRSGIDQPDEVGRLARSFDQMTAALSAREQELRRAAEVETRLRERFEVLTSSIEEALIAVAADGTVQTVNPAAEELLGVTAEEVLGERAGDVVVGRAVTGEPLLAALGAAEVSDVRAVRGRLRGSRGEIDISATAAPLRTEEERSGRVYVFRDVTGEMEAERMKTEFLANVSHELRTPLTPIRGYAEVLRRREVPPEKVAGFADNIVEATHRLERIVGMLVDFSALEAGRIDIRLEEAALDDVVDEALRRWRERHPDRRFSRYIEQGLPHVVVDRSLLDRMLEELIDNAVKFSDGPVRIRGRLDEGRVRLSVADEGVGIPEEEIAAITEDFRQIDGGATRRYGGLGLGLSLVLRIVDRTGADLEIRSVEGEGTEVELILPTAPRSRRRGRTRPRGQRRR